MDEPLYEKRFYCHLTVRFGHMEQTLSTKPISQETLKSSSPVRQKDVDWLFYRVMLHTREVDGREVCSSQIREELEKNVASEVQVKGFNSQEISGLQSAGNIHLPRVQTDRFKKRDASCLVLHAFDSLSKNSRMREETPTQRHLQLLSAQLREVKDDVWSISSDFFCRCHVAPRGQQNVPSEPSFPIHLKKSDVVRQTKTHLETLEERIIDVFWNVCRKIGSVSLDFKLHRNVHRKVTSR